MFILICPLQVKVSLLCPLCDQISEQLKNKQMNELKRRDVIKKLSAASVAGGVIGLLMGNINEFWANGA